MDKEDVVHTHTHTHTHTVEYYLAIKNKEIMPLAIAWMNLEFIRLNEISQAENYKCYMRSLIYGIFKKW